MLFFLALADLVSTGVGLSIGAQEANSYMATVVDTAVGVGVKLILTPIVLMAMVTAGSRHAPRTCALVLATGVAIYAWAVLSNLAVISDLCRVGPDLVGKVELK